MHAHGVFINHLAATANNLNTRGLEAVFDAVVFFHLHECAPRHEALHREAFRHRRFAPGNRSASHRACDERCFAQGFRGNRSSVHHRATRTRLALNNRNPTTELSRDERSLFARRPSSNAKKVVLPHGNAIGSARAQLQRDSVFFQPRQKWRNSRVKVAQSQR